MNEDELAEVMAEEAAADVDKRDPYAFGLGKKVRVRTYDNHVEN